MKRIVFFLLFLALAVPAWATTTVTGNMKNLGTSSITGGFVRFWLRGCAGNQPRITGTGLIAPSLGGVFYFDFPANSSGIISGTLYSNRDATGLLGGEIECGGSYTATWYGMQAFFGGKGGPEVAVYAKNGGTLDISNVTPITYVPVLTSPSGDSSYLRLDAGNSPVTGPVTFTGGINGNPVFSGAPSTAVLNKVYMPMQCGVSPVPSWCSGSELGAWTNAAISNCTGVCDIYWPAGTLSVSSTVIVNSPSISIHGAGSRASHVFFSGTDALLIQPSSFVPNNELGVFSGFTIEGNGTSTSCIHLVNSNQAKFYDVTCRGFTGASGNLGSGWWMDNQTSDWSERITCVDCFSYSNRKAWRFTQNGGTNSFARFHCIACYVNIEQGQIGVSAENGANVYDSTFDLSGNIDDVPSSGGTLFNVDGTSQIGPGAFFNVHVEGNVTAAHGGSTCIAIATGGTLMGEGQIECLNSAATPMTNSISTQAHFSLPRDPLATEFSNSGVRPWNIVQTINGQNGICFSCRWDGSLWQITGDGGSNGAGMILEANSTGEIDFYSVPNAGCCNTTFPNSSTGTYLGFQVGPTANKGRNIPIVTSFTTTGATTDNVTVTGMTASGHCSLTATNAGAAGGIASVYVSNKTTNQITVTHTATAGWTFDVLCTPN